MKLFWTIAFIIHGGAIIASGTRRIIGGTPTTVVKYPSIVQVESLNEDTGEWSFKCGASILTSNFVLSAAKCFSGRDYKHAYRRIRAGATNRNSGGIIINVAKAVNHLSYRGGASGDISVVRLAKPLSLSPTIKQATILAQDSVVPDNLPVVLAGWGLATPDLDSIVLREVSVNIINSTQCSERYSGFLEFVNITKSNICFAGDHASFDDVGGPVYYDNIVVGVISGSYEFGDGGYPGVGTAIASYTDWIIANAK